MQTIFESKTGLIAVIILTLFGMVVTVSAQGSKKFTKKDLPPAVLKAFEQAYPKAEIKGASKEKEKKTTYYEIESVDGKTKRDILYTEDGTVHETEETIAASALPDAVMKAIKANSPKAKIEKAEKLMHDSVVEYEVVLVKNKQKTELVVDPSGKIVKTEKKGKGNEEDEDEESEEKEE